jgi:uncharacterized membrane protein
MLFQLFIKSSLDTKTKTIMSELIAHEVKSLAMVLSRVGHRVTFVYGINGPPQMVAIMT